MESKERIQSTLPDTRQVEAVCSKLRYAHEPELHCCLATQGILTLSVCTFNDKWSRYKCRSAEKMHVDSSSELWGAICVKIMFFLLFIYPALHL